MDSPNTPNRGESIRMERQGKGSCRIVIAHLVTTTSLARAYTTRTIRISQQIAERTQTMLTGAVSTGQERREIGL